MSGRRPAYLYLGLRELRRRAAEAVASLADCRVCPRDCRVDRLADKWSACKTGRHAVVGSAFAHFGEEDCLRGWNGSGTIFFSHCNLRCVFCLAPDTLVATDGGLVPIADLFEEADPSPRAEVRIPREVRVATRDGGWAPLAKAFRHDFSGELVRLKPFNSPPVSLTPDHPVLAVRPAAAVGVRKVPAGQLSKRDRVLIPQRGLGETEEGSLAPILEIERVPYRGPVYNLEVDHPDHAFLAPFVAVGNCQNWDISQGVRPGPAATPASEPREVARLMLDLQARGCHNVNFVTPEHVVPQVLEALVLAVEGGLRLPLVYNTSAYDSLESLRWLDGVVDVYMPDFKCWSPGVAKTYMKAEGYPEVARRVIREMHRQVGNLVVDAEGLAVRGLLLRHLVMPGQLDETRKILEWVAAELGPDTYVNLMDQYYPAGRVGGEHYPEINRRLSSAEFAEARSYARELGLRRLDARDPHPGLRQRLSRISRPARPGL